MSQRVTGAPVFSACSAHDRDFFLQVGAWYKKGAPLLNYSCMGLSFSNKKLESGWEMKSCSFWEESLLGDGGRGNPVFLALLNWEGGKEGVGLIHLPDTYFSYWIFIDFLHLLFVFNTLSRNFISFFKIIFFSFSGRASHKSSLCCHARTWFPLAFMFLKVVLLDIGFLDDRFHNPHPHTLNMLSHCLLPSIILFF